MSDAELRDRERRCRDGHAALEEQVALLTGRLRAGTLSRERLDLAAHCGHEAAALAGGAASPPAGEPIVASLPGGQGRFPWRLRWWAVGLRRWGPAAWARAVSTAVAVTAEAAEGLAARRAFFDEVSAAIEGWGDCPCDAHLAAARRRVDGDREPGWAVGRDAVGAIEATLEPLRFGPFEHPDRMREIGRAASIAGGLIVADEASLTLLVHDPGPRSLTTMGALHSALGLASEGGWYRPSSGQPFLAAAEAAGEDVVRRRVQERLIAWALA